MMAAAFRGMMVRTWLSPELAPYLHILSGPPQFTIVRAVYVTGCAVFKEKNKTGECHFVLKNA